MRRHTWTLVALLSVASPGGPAFAGQPKAMVKGASYNWLDTESVPCGVLIESQLRDLGFEVIERTLPEKRASVVVFMTATCSGIWHPHLYGARGYHPDSHCRVHAVVRGRGVRNFGLRGKGDSNTGHLSALSAACRQVAEKLDSRLGGSGNIDIEKGRRAQTGKRRLRVVLRWKGDLKPMPLITATHFFQRAGYESKLLKGGAKRCSFRVTIQDTRERFSHLLQTYLESKYKVRLAKNAGAELVFALSGK